MPLGMTHSLKTVVPWGSVCLFIHIHTRPKPLSCHPQTHRTMAWFSQLWLLRMEKSLCSQPCGLSNSTDLPVNFPLYLTVGPVCLIGALVLPQNYCFIFIFKHISFFLRPCVEILKTFASVFKDLLPPLAGSHGPSLSARQLIHLFTLQSFVSLP